jgi:O-antigen/teichoic acid export membrane protein
VVAHHERHRLARVVALPSVVISLMCACTGVVALLVPDAIGARALGDTWTAARHVLLPQALVFALLAAESGALIGLRTTGRVGTALRAQAVSAVLVVAVGLAGARAGGAAGALWGVAGCRLVLLPLWWLPFTRERSRTAAVPEPVPTGSPAPT